MARHPTFITVSILLATVLSMAQVGFAADIVVIKGGREAGSSFLPHKDGVMMCSVQQPEGMNDADWSALRQVHLHGPVDVFDSIRMKQALNAIEIDDDVTSVTISICSPGGVYFEAPRMIEAIRDYAERSGLQIVTCAVDRGAWSAAAMVWLAGDVLQIAEGASAVGFHAPYDSRDLSKVDELVPEVRSLIETHLGRMEDRAFEAAEGGGAPTVLRKQPSFLADSISDYIDIAFNAKGSQAFLVIKSDFDVDLWEEDKFANHVTRWSGAYEALVQSAMVAPALVKRPMFVKKQAGVDKLGVAVADTEAGVLLRTVASGSLGDELGAKAGDVLLSIGEERVETWTRISPILNSIEAGSIVSLTVKREGVGVMTLPQPSRKSDVLAGLSTDVIPLAYHSWFSETLDHANEETALAVPAALVRARYLRDESSAALQPLQMGRALVPVHALMGWEAPGFASPYSEWGEYLFWAAETDEQTTGLADWMRAPVARIASFSNAVPEDVRARRGRVAKILNRIRQILTSESRYDEIHCDNWAVGFAYHCKLSQDETSLVLTDQTRWVAFGEAHRLPSERDRGDFDDLTFEPLALRTIAVSTKSLGRCGTKRVVIECTRASGSVYKFSLGNYDEGDNKEVLALMRELSQLVAEHGR